MFFINLIKPPKNFIQQFNQVIIIMGVHTVYNKLVVTTEFFCFDLPKDVEKKFGA